MSSYAEIIRFIEYHTGIDLKPVNMMSFNGYLDDRLKDFNGSAQVYLNILKTVKEEYERLLDHVTINETYFFREEKQFKYLRDVFIPEKNNEGGSINIWSASCSSGEEPVSLYALMNGKLRLPFKVYASDINAHILNKFRKGIFRKGALRTDGKLFHELLDEVSSRSEGSEELSIKEDVMNKIDIREINLYNDSLADLPMMDCVFLRNTLIYMNLENKQKVINKITEKLKNRGILILSASEVAHISHPQLEVISSDYCYFLRKKDPLHMEPANIQPVPSHIISAEPVKKVIHKAELQAPPDEKQVCLFITNILNNPIFTDDDSPALRSAEKFADILSELGRNNLKKAEVLFAQLKPNEHPQSLYSFFGGFIPLQKGDKSAALSAFQKVLDANPAFWPARYYITFSCGTSSAGEEIHLGILTRDIDRYISDKRIDYQFLLEGFNAKYFREICRARLDNLKEGVRYGN